MTNEKLLEILKRDAIDIFSIDGLKEKLESGKKLKIKLGADPSRPDLHLGHSVVIRKLKLFQELGHEVIFVIGDFTGMIGDPSGKSKTRPSLTLEQTRESGQTYFKQVTKILDAQKTRIVYNSEWLSPMKFDDVLRLAGKYTLARILERDDFAKRYKENMPIGLHEILYPLVQGYDSVALHADIEVGGTDQTFNLLVGRELQKDYDQQPQEVITFPLLPGLDGVEKMSKSLDNYIGLDEAPEAMFEKAMKIPDNLIESYFRLTTDLDEASYTDLIKNNIREAHFAYAREIIKMYHGEEFILAAEQRYNEVAAGGIPDDVPEFEVANKNHTLIELLVISGLADSNSDARRLITGKGIKVNNEPMSDPKTEIQACDSIILSRGKNRFAKIIFKD